MSRLPYLYSPNLSSYDQQGNIQSPDLSRPLLLASPQSEQDSHINLDSAKTRSRHSIHHSKDSSLSILHKKTQTTMIAMRNNAANPFKVLPLHSMRESADESSDPNELSIRSNTDRRDWNAVLRSRRNTSAGSTPTTDNKRTIHSKSTYQYSTFVPTTARDSTSRHNPWATRHDRYTKICETDDDHTRTHEREQSDSSLMSSEILRRIRDSLALSPNLTARRPWQQFDSLRDVSEDGPECHHSLDSIFEAAHTPRKSSVNARVVQSNREDQHTALPAIGARRRSATASEYNHRRSATDGQVAHDSPPKRRATIRRHAIYAQGGIQLPTETTQDADEGSSTAKTKATRCTSMFPGPNSNELATPSRESKRKSMMPPSTDPSKRHSRMPSAKFLGPADSPLPARGRVVLADLDVNTLPLPMLTVPSTARRPTGVRTRHDSASTPVNLRPCAPLKIQKRGMRDTLDGIVAAGLNSAMAARSPPQCAGEAFLKGPVYHPSMLDLIYELDVAIAEWDTMHRPGLLHA